jgi:hypothetical protein
MTLKCNAGPKTAAPTAADLDRYDFPAPGTYYR